MPQLPNPIFPPRTYAMSSQAGSNDVERLKEEGNALFIKNDFEGAYKKYTEALQYDDTNAVLYCNRAACSYGRNR